MAELLLLRLMLRPFAWQLSLAWPFALYRLGRRCSPIWKGHGNSETEGMSVVFIFTLVQWGMTEGYALK